MSWTIMYDVMQWMDVNGDPASGYVIKAYEPGTTTPISIAIDKNGGSPQATVTLNAEGKPEVSGNEVMLFIDRDYKWAIFENATDATNNSNPYAGFFDNVPQQNSTTSIGYDANTTLKQKLDNLDVGDYAELKDINVSQLVNNDSINVAYRLTEEDGGGGAFVWSDADLSANVAADPEEGIYIPPNSDSSGSSGAWVRLNVWPYNARFWGAHPDRSAGDNTTALNAAFTYADNKNLYIPSGIYSINAAVTAKGSFYGDGQRGTIIRQSVDTQGVVIVESGTDLVTIRDIQLTYDSPSNTQTATNLLIESDTHSLLIDQVFCWGGDIGIHSDELSFTQTYRNVRIQDTTSTSLRVDGDTNAVSGAGTTVHMSQIACYQGGLGILVQVVKNLNLSCIEIGTHTNHGIFLNNVVQCTADTLHFELNNYAAVATKARIYLFSSGLDVVNIHSQDNTSTTTNYIFRISEDSTVRLFGIERLSDTNTQLYYIDDSAGITSDKIHYIFDGPGLTSSETGNYAVGSSGVMSFPQFEEYLYTNTTTGGTGKITQTLPSSIPGELTLHSVNSFIDDQDLSLGVSSDRFSGSYSVWLRNLSDGSKAINDGVPIRSVVKYWHNV